MIISLVGTALLGMAFGVLSDHPVEAGLVAALGTAGVLLIVRGKGQ